MIFDELVSAMPISDPSTRLPISGPDTGLRYELQPFEYFIRPTFREDAGNVAGCKVIIISAPGAVGKSTVAREIAHVCGAPLWDLSQDKPVGHHSLTGALMSGFGVGNVGTVFQGIKNGELLVVIDALDEARVKTNEAAFAAFISDVVGLAKDANGIPFVLLGRTQIAEQTWLLLEESGISTALVEIEPFDRDSARSYIDKRVHARGEHVWSRVAAHRKPFEEARDAIFGLLSSAIDGVDAPKEPSTAAYDFLGYAPVLDAMAELLAGATNFHELKSRIADDVARLAPSAKDTPVALLCSIVEAILKREHEQKLVSNIKPALQQVAAQSSWDNWSQLYTPREQIDRLLARMTGTAYQLGDPTIPPPVRAAYEGQLTSWLQEHPFLRHGTTPANVVFESYLLAQILADSSSTGKTAAEQFVGQSHYKPSSLLAEFYLLAMSANAHRQVPAEHIGILYDSMLAGETESRRLRLSLDGPETTDLQESGAGVEGDLEFLYWQDDDSAVVVSKWSFATEVTKESRISFCRSLREAAVVVPCDIQLGNAGAEFRLGANVSLRASRLSISCATLIVESHRRRSGDDGTVTLEADECQCSMTERPTVRGELQVSWPGSERFPWTEYQMSTPGASYPTPALRETYRRFRRIVMTLQSHSKGSLARLRHKVEHQRILQGRLGEQLLTKLVEDQILYLDNNFYHWNPNKAVLVGVSWMDLRKGLTTDSLTRYMETFIEANRELF